MGFSPGQRVSLVALLALATFLHAAAQTCPLGSFGPDCSQGNAAWYVGCFNDGVVVRDLPFVAPVNNVSSLTAPLCTALCGGLGYNFAGVQAGQTCFCGDTVGKLGSAGTAKCRSFVCPGDATQWCGGTLANAVFRTDFFIAPPVISADKLYAYSQGTFSVTADTQAVAPTFTWSLAGQQETGDNVVFWLGPGGSVPITVTADNNVMKAVTTTMLTVFAPIQLWAPSALRGPVSTPIPIDFELRGGAFVNASLLTSANAAVSSLLLPDPLYQRVGPAGLSTLSIFTPPQTVMLVDMELQLQATDVILLAGQPATTASLLEAIEIYARGSGSINVYVFRPVCSNATLRYCRWTSTCSLACAPPAVVCMAGSTFCPSTASCVLSPSACPASVPASSPTWTQANPVASAAVNVTSGFQHVVLPQPLAIGVGDVVGVGHSSLLAWAPASAAIVAAAVPAVGGSVRLLSPNITTPWFAAHTIVPTLASFPVSSSTPETRFFRVSASDGEQTVTSDPISVTFEAVLTSASIAVVAERPLGQASLLTVLVPGSNVSTLNVSWSLQGSGKLVVYNISTASFTASSAGAHNISVRVCSFSTCLHASRVFTVAALLQQLTVSTPTFGVPLGTPTTLSIATTPASLALCVVGADGVNYTVSFSAEASVADFSFTVANPGAHITRVTCSNMYSNGTVLTQTQPIIVLGSLVNVSASLLQASLTLPVGSVGNLTTLLSGDSAIIGNASSFSTALVWRSPPAIIPLFTNSLTIEVSLPTLNFSWGMVLVSGPSTLLALPFMVLTTVVPQWSSVTAAGLAIAGQPIPFAPVLAAGSLPANVTLLSGAPGVANVTGMAQPCVEAGCAAALAACPQPAACLCAVTCPQCACAWPTSNMPALEALFACARALACPLSLNYSVAGSFNMTFVASNALGSASGVTVVAVQQLITSANILGPSFVRINTTVTLTAQATGSNQRFQWTVNGTAAGTNASISRRFLSEGSVLIGLTVTNNVSSVTEQTTLAVQDTTKLLSLECPSNVAVGTTVSCVAVATNIFRASIAWFVNNQRVVAGVDGLTFNFSSNSVQRAVVRVVLTNAFSTSSKELAVSFAQPLTFLNLVVSPATVGSATNVTPVHDGSSVKCVWSLGYVAAYRADEISTNELDVLSRVFPTAGVYRVGATCSNAVSSLAAQAWAAVTDPSASLLLKGPTAAFTGAEVTLCVTDGVGLDLDPQTVVVWTVSGQTQANSSVCWSPNTTVPGSFAITATVAGVSTLVREFIVQDRIRGLQFVAPSAVPVSTAFNASVVTTEGSDIRFMWFVQGSLFIDTSPTSFITLNSSTPTTRSIGVSVFNLIDTHWRDTNVAIQIPIAGFALTAPAVVASDSNYTLAAAGVGSDVAFTWMLTSLSATNSTSIIANRVSSASIDVTAGARDVLNASVVVGNRLGSVTLWRVIRVQDVLAAPVLSLPSTFVVAGVTYLATDASVNLTILVPSGSDFVLSIMDDRNRSVANLTRTFAGVTVVAFTPLQAGNGHLIVTLANGLGNVSSMITFVAQTPVSGMNLIGSLTLLRTNPLQYAVSYAAGTAVDLVGRVCDAVGCVQHVWFNVASPSFRNGGLMAAGTNTAVITATLSNFVSSKTLTLSVEVLSAVSPTCAVEQPIVALGTAARVVVNNTAAGFVSNSVSWGNGAIIVANGVPTPGSQTHSRTYTNPGRYTIRVTTSNAVSSLDCGPLTVDVLSLVAGLSVVAPAVVIAGVPFTITATLIRGTSTTFWLTVGALGSLLYSPTLATDRTASWTLVLPDPVATSFTVSVSNALSLLNFSQSIEAQAVLLSTLPVSVRGVCGSGLPLSPSSCPPNSPLRHRTNVSFAIAAPARVVSAVIFDGEPSQSMLSPSAQGAPVFVFNRTLVLPGVYTAVFSLANNVSAATVTYPFEVLPYLLAAKITAQPPTLVNSTTVFVLNAQASAAPFQATVDWDFGDGTTVRLPLGAPVAHLYSRVGVFNVTAAVFNGVGLVHTYVRHIVQAQVCLPPVISVGEPGATFSYTRLDTFRLRGSAVYNCSNFTALDMRWVVRRVSSDPAAVVALAELAAEEVLADLPRVASAVGQALDIPAGALALGTYAFSLTATLNGSYPLIDSTQTVLVTIVSAPVVARINNSADSTVAWQRAQGPLVLSAESSWDPDGTHTIAQLSFAWTCISYVYPASCSATDASAQIAASAASCFTTNTTGTSNSTSTSSVEPLTGSMLSLGSLRTDRSVFVFAVTAQRTGPHAGPCDPRTTCDARVVVRATSVSQLSVRILGAGDAVNRNDRTLLTAQCLSCDSGASLTYHWSLDQAGCPPMPAGVGALEELTANGINASRLVIPPYTLPTDLLRVAVTVTNTATGMSGMASAVVVVRDPPAGGRCAVVDAVGAEVSSGVELSTLFTITCVNWSASGNPRGALTNAPGLLFSFRAITSNGLTQTLGGGLGVSSVSKYLARSVVEVEVTVADNDGAATVVRLPLLVNASVGQPDSSASELFQSQYAALLNSGDREGQRAMALTISASLNAAPLGPHEASARANRLAMRTQFLQDLASSSLDADDLASSSSVLMTVLGGSTPRASDTDPAIVSTGAQLLSSMAASAASNGASDAVFTNLLQAAGNMLSVMGSLYASAPGSSAQAAVEIMRSSEIIAAAMLADAVASEPAVTYTANNVTFRFARESGATSSVSGPSGAAFGLPAAALTATGGDFLSNLQVFTTNPYAATNATIQTGVVSLVLQNGTSGTPIPISNLSDTFLIQLPVTTQPASPNATVLVGQQLTRHRVTHGASNCSQCATHVLIQPLNGEVNLTLTIQSSNGTGPQVGLNLTSAWTSSNSASFAFLIPPTAWVGTLQSYYAASDSVATVLTGSTGSFGVAGTYTVLIRNNAPAATNVSYRFVVFETECGFWDESAGAWSTQGCTASAQAQPALLACRCNHLTAFGSRVVVVPNFVDPLDASLFSNLESNAVVFSVVVLVWCLYFVALIYAHRADQRDKLLLGPINLAENRPTHQAAYEVVVITGARPNAGTTSNVYIQMSGLFGSSSARQLHHPWRPVFTRGAVDTFYMTLPASLGPLQRLRVWHDHVDDSADATWFLKRIRVTDLQTGEVWYFICNRWLALELDDGLVERTLDAMSAEELDNFSTAFGDHVSHGFADNHIWLSVFARPAQSRFTRKQRVTCVLCLLLLTMLTSLLFYREDRSQRTFEQEIFVGVSSALIIFPIIFLFINLFRYSRNKPRHDAANNKTDELSGLPLKGSGTSLSPSSVQLSMGPRGEGSSSSPLPGNTESNTDLWTTLFKLQNRRSGPTALDGCRAADVVDADLDGHDSEIGGDEHLDQGDEDDMMDEDDKPKFSLPPWVRYVAWLLILFTNIFVSYWVILFGLSFGASMSWAWLRSLVTAVLTSILLLQPLQVILLAMLIAYIYKRHDDRARPDDDYDEDEELAAQNSGLVSQLRRRRRMYKPRRHKRRAADVRLQRARRLQELKMARVFKEAMLYLFFFWLLCVVVYAEFDREVPLFADAVSNALGAGELTPADANGTSTMAFSQINSAADWWAWLEGTLLPRLFWSQRYNGQPTFTNTYISDGTAALVGGVQLRQLRVYDNSCDVLSELSHLIGQCRAPWSPDSNQRDDMYLYDSAGVRNTSGTRWAYRSAADTGMHDYISDLMTYPGSGFTQLLPSTLAAGQTLVAALKEGQWTDRNTRVVFVELSVYNPNANLFAAVQLVAEFLATGDVITSSLVAPLRLYRYLGPKGSFQMACEIMFVLVLVYYTVLEAQKIYRAGLLHFTAYRNVLEFVVVSLALFCVGFNLFRIVFVEQTMNSFVNAGRGVFASSFHWMAHWDRTVRILQAVLLFFATLKFLVVLRHNKVLNLMARTLRTAMVFLHSFLVVVVVLWLGFVIWGYVSFGSDVQDFATIPNTMYTLWRLSLGDFTFSQFPATNRVVGPIYFVLYAFFFYILIMNIFIAVMSEAFSATKRETPPDTGLSLSEYILAKLRWYTGLSLGRPPKPRSKESPAAMCEEALAKAAQIEGRLEMLLNSSPPASAPHTPMAVRAPPPTVPVRSMRRSKGSRPTPAAAVAAVAAADGSVGASAKAPPRPAAPPSKLAGRAGPVVRPTAANMRVFARSHTEQSMSPSLGASLASRDATLLSNAEL